MHLIIFGEGSDGFLNFEEKQLDFGMTMVNFIQKKKIIIKNKSNVTFNVALHI